jgi:hypothetical protein
LAGVIHEERFGKNYHFSWLAVGKDTKWDWEGARNYCRRFCMDSIAIGSKEENTWVKGLLKQGNVPYIWTGGHSFCIFLPTFGGVFVQKKLFTNTFLLFLHSCFRKFEIYIRPENQGPTWS